MRRTFPIVLVAACLVAASALLWAEEAEPVKTPVELGAVPWLRDFDAAVTKARTEKKPLLVLFQEVPG